MNRICGLAGNRVLGLSALTLFSMLTMQAGSVTIGGPDTTLAPNSDAWAWDGGELTGYRGAITDPANFGPGGIDPNTINIADLTTIDSGTLAGINVFIAPWWYNTDSAPYNTLIENWFLNGGNLILLDDDPTTDAIAADLGFGTSGSDGTVSNGGAPLFNGPFGTASDVTQSGDTGQLDTTNLATYGASICATNASGQTTAICDPAGSYAPGAGALLILGDVDMWTDGGATYSPLNDNGIFALNGTAWIVDQAADEGAVPEPGTFALLPAGLLALALLKRRT